MSVRPRGQRAGRYDALLLIPGVIGDRGRGFRTGDIVRAIIPEGKYAGTHVGRIAIRGNGTCVLKAASGLKETHYRHFQPLHRSDGYNYQKGTRAFASIP